MESFTRHLATVVAGEVRDDPGTRAAYATDASNHRVPPRCVVFPRTVEDLVAVVEACRDAEVPLTTRGAGTNCAGNAVGPGVVVDTSRYLKGPAEVDADAGTAVVQPGMVLDRLQEQVSEHGLRFGVDPSTHSRCTLGGMIGTNACGSHSVAWGTTADNVLSLEVLLPDGRIVELSSGRPVDEAHTAVMSRDGAGSDLRERLGRVRDAFLSELRTELGQFGRQISGYALHHLLPEHGFDVAKAFVGSEGTCAVVTSARVRLVRPPRQRALVVAGFLDEIAAAVAAPELSGSGALTVEGMDVDVVETFDRRLRSRRPALPRGRAWLLIEVGADDRAHLHERAQHVRALADRHGSVDSVIVSDPVDQRGFWSVRERGAGLASRDTAGREYWPGWEDAAVPPHRLGEYLASFRALLRRHGRRGMVYGHFGEGCVHVRIDHDLLSERGRTAYRRFQEDAADLVIANGGSLSGEHGDGRARSELLARMYSAPVLDAFRAFKSTFDPTGLFNPGVLVDPRPLDADLRAPGARPYTKDLGLLYPDDDGDFAKALRRCTGVGACRKSSGGGMCPSYRATGDERHTTRGRARLLAEMLDGSVVTDGWRSEEVAEALDLCLMCKACSTECPVGVDMATYKAEFLHQRYRHRPRPRSHYSMGWLPVLLALGRRAPRVANRLVRRPWLAALAKRAGGIDPRRGLPELAEESFTRWFRDRRPARSDERVVLLADCFTKSFSPSAARAAVLVMEAAGYQVDLAPRGSCCGLPWMSTGQLGSARRVLDRTLRRLDAGDPSTPVVMLEPSCASMLRHDAQRLVDSESARRVGSRVRSFAEVVEGRGLEFTPQEFDVLAQFHCHQRATGGTAADRSLVEAAGGRLRSVDEGCCGLAGNFGFEAGHYDVSTACAEEALLPAVADHPADAPVLADGFSCRLQVHELAGRPSMHLAELLLQRMAGARATAEATAER